MLRLYVLLCLFLMRSIAAQACESAISAQIWQRQTSFERQLMAALFREPLADTLKVDSLRSADPNLEFGLYETNVNPNLSVDAFAQVSLKQWQALGLTIGEFREILGTRESARKLKSVLKNIFKPLQTSRSDLVTPAVKNLETTLKAMVESILTDKEGRVFMGNDGPSGPFVVAFLNSHDHQAQMAIPGKALVLIIARRISSEVKPEEVPVR